MKTLSIFSDISNEISSVDFVCNEKNCSFNLLNKFFVSLISSWISFIKEHYLRNENRVSKEWELYLEGTKIFFRISNKKMSGLANDRLSAKAIL
ncbi:hypothetical protein RIR_jg23352.t1 [Rhizophagus irregularis DAOM 181602=DAOM 197198]|nr:hypothetical protein RIR_jg23352.t1 [Rhizophagus irregularis DAOM 181602=DAOM 197198]